MFSILLLGLAAVAGSDPVIVVDDRAMISIDIVGYDLRQAADTRRLERRIRQAADRVCVRGYGVAIYLERVACVKSAIAEGDRQLREHVAQRGSGAPLASTIAIMTSTK
jgi:UrcA family protein